MVLPDPGAEATAVSQPKRNPFPAYVIGGIDSLTQAMVDPALPLYITEKFGTDLMTTGFLMAIHPAVQFLTVPYLGKWSDKIGRRPVLMATQLLNIGSLAALALTNSLWVAFLARALMGVAGGCLSIAYAELADCSTPEDRSRIFGTAQKILVLPWIGGPILTGFLYQMHPAYPLALVALWSLLGFYTTAKYMSPAEPKTSKTISEAVKESTIALITEKRAWLNLAAIFCFTLPLRSHLANMSILAKQVCKIDGRPLTAAEFSYFCASIGLIATFCQFVLLKKALAHLGNFGLAVVAYVCITYGFFSLALVGGLGTLLISTIFISGSNGLLRVTLYAFMSLRGSSHRQVALMGSVQAVYSLCSVLGPVMAGAFMKQNMRLEWSITLGLIGVLGLVILVFFMDVGQNKDRWLL